MLESFLVSKFLPRTIITLNITLPQEDQEVLFDLVAFSLKAFSMDNVQGKNIKKGRKKIISHTPCFVNISFDCYVDYRYESKNFCMQP